MARGAPARAGDDVGLGCGSRRADGVRARSRSVEAGAAAHAGRCRPRRLSLGRRPASAATGRADQEGRRWPQPGRRVSHRRGVRLCRFGTHGPVLQGHARIRLLHRRQRIAALQPHRRCARSRSGCDQRLDRTHAPRHPCGRRHSLQTRFRDRAQHAGRAASGQLHLCALAPLRRRTHLRLHVDGRARHARAAWVAASGTTSGFRAAAAARVRSCEGGVEPPQVGADLLTSH